MTALTLPALAGIQTDCYPMATTGTTEPAWDIFVIEVKGRVCLLAYSSQGQTFVTRWARMGEPFGNGLILDIDRATEAFDSLDALGLSTRTL